jgi:4-hydroxy-2-oxoheptanedioate aldolase
MERKVRPNPLKELFAKKVTALVAWQQVPAPLVGELLGYSGVDAVCLDLQHSPIFVETAVPIMQAICATPATPIVRVSATSFQEINRVLDNGAYGVIAPLINTEADAREFMRACLYPPYGERSWGAPRGMMYGGDDYFDHANETILKLAMIETCEGLQNLEAILGVRGLDGIFIGPSDLSISLIGKPAVNWQSGPLAHALQEVLTTCKKMGKYAGIFCTGIPMANDMKTLGYDMVTLGPDLGILKAEYTNRVKMLR